MGRLIVAPRDQMDVHLKSRRAPYTRGGVRFGSNRDEVVVPGDQITDAQLDKLAADPAISIALVNRETGERQEFAKLTAEPEAPAGEPAPVTEPAPAPAAAPAPAPAPRKGKTAKPATTGGNA
ncbi:hypothetical protein JIP62_10450 [Brevundimonas vitis]|uniref:Mu-like prophage FluMu N-terminal domain-containing protein n=1 Tax=Brevundimonas vitisensis TaxID=2800818 RepID=A0ABX7BJN5_9CAUL|nr:hypothetical protein [Brevundimonas vitisensis]QQQ17752.1 hypothetical protein JIP62_10450 [Brevundimonas vitisensis]